METLQAILILIFLLMAIGLFLWYDKKHTKANNERRRKEKENYKSLLSKYEITLTVNAGKYLTGHIELNNPISNVFIGFSKERLYIISKEIPEGIIKGTIDYNKIENILVEDASTIENRITATRLALVGVFAWAIKKKEKHVLYYTTIVNSNGRFTNEVVFEFEGEKAMMDSTRLKNEIVKKINEIELNKETK